MKDRLFARLLPLVEWVEARWPWLRDDVEEGDC